MVKPNSNWFEQYGITDPYYADKYRVIIKGDCREVLSSIRGASAVVTDPPYELGFMGKSWDSKGVSFSPATWSIIRQSCLSGAPMLSFGGTRTQHRIACAIEDAGWEIRDCVLWVYGSGFPKSLDISKAIDKASGVERPVLGVNPNAKGRNKNKTGGDYGNDHAEDRSLVDVITAPATLESALWNGWGTALKPAYEPIILAMNLVDKTFANNALKHGVAGLNIDECRVPFVSDADKEQATVPQPIFNSPTGAVYNFKTGEGRNGDTYDPSKGRFPANLIHDGSDEVVELFPQSKDGVAVGGFGNAASIYGSKLSKHEAKNQGYGGAGSAARFFYCAKASRSERDGGCDDLVLQRGDVGEYRPNDDGTSGIQSRLHGATIKGHNNHPTVKPLALMNYLCKLIKMPEYNLILDPFCGSGTTLLACGNLGIHSVGIDSDEKSCEIAANRCAADTVARIQRGEY